MEEKREWRQSDRWARQWAWVRLQSCDRRGIESSHGCHSRAILRPCLQLQRWPSHCLTHMGLPLGRKGSAELICSITLSHYELSLKLSLLRPKLRGHFVFLSIISTAYHFDTMLELTWQLNSNITLITAKLYLAIMNFCKIMPPFVICKIILSLFEFAHI